jgi:hypothetical protein
MATMSTKSVATRLAIQPGHSIHVVNGPADHKQLLGQLPAGARLVDARGLPADRVVLFTSTRSELDKLLPKAIGATAPDGALWVAYPKQGPKLKSKQSDLSRQVVHDEIRLAGWKPVSQISVDDDVWSAIRARPASAAERKRV